MISFKSYFFNIIICSFLLTVPILTHAKTPFYYKQTSYDMRLSYESITTPANNPMGLMGVHYELNNFFHPKAYLGIGGYGAITGDYGGFFTAGITPGIRFIKFYPFLIDVGLFIGGGGGASAFPGDGEMLRAHGYIGYMHNTSKIWLGINKQQISKTTLDPTISFGYSSKISFLSQIKSPKKSTYLTKNIPKSYAFHVNPAYTTYFPTSKNQGRNSTQIESSIGLLSLDITKELNHNVTGIFSLSGSNDSPADGYGAIFIGTGYTFKYDLISFFPQLKLGMAGGGNIDTGGGLLIHPQVMSHIKLNQIYAISSSLGYIHAPTGSFNSWQASLGLTYTAQLHELNQINKDIITTPNESPYNITWFIENKTTFPVKNIHLKSGKDYEDSIQFFGCGASFPLNSFTHAIVSTYWAYDGEVGAYAEGNFGINMIKKLNSKFNLGIELLLGAAGGGGINVNQGTIHQETLNMSYTLSKTNALLFKIGRQGAFSSDSFHGTVINLGIQNKINLL